MMRLRNLWLGAGIVALVGCEGMMSREDDPMYLKMNELESRLARVERLVNNEGLVNLMSELNAAQAELQTLRNEVETLQHDVEQSGNRQRDLYLDVDQRLQAIEKAGANRNVFEGGSLSPGQLPVPGGTDRANYQAAFELLKQGRYDQAAIALQQFMVAFPTSELSGQCAVLARRNALRDAEVQGGAAGIPESCRSLSGLAQDSGRVAEDRLLQL